MTTPTVRPEGVAYGECWCGCGGRTTLARQSSQRDGLVRGEPVRFLRGHGRPRIKPPKSEDCGYVTPCLIWQGYISATGYGQATRNGRPVNAHAAAWADQHGPVPKGMHVDHLCRNRACVNPDHLEAVTAAENVRRGTATKLSKDQVRSIRADGRRLSDIASDYGVSVPSVSMIRNHRSWTSDMGDVEPAKLNPYRRQALESAAEVVGEIMTARTGRPWVGIVKDPVVEDASQLFADVLNARGDKRWVAASTRDRNLRTGAAGHKEAA